LNVQKFKIVLIGSGNVGYQLGRRFFEQGLQIVQVFSRKAEKAERLAKAIGCDFTTQLNLVTAEADIYILAVHDSSVGEVAKKLSNILPADKIVVHTSGATPSTVLAPFFPNCGVFYPLQTLSIDRAADFDTIPICVDAAFAETQEMLLALGQRISKQVQIVTDEERAVLHVAAVFVNNFANHLFQIGARIVEEEGISFDLLRPLILETALKIQNHAPADMQTGPARRCDASTIRRHERYLEKFPAYRELYTVLTQSLINHFKK